MKPFFVLSHDSRPDDLRVVSKIEKGTFSSTQLWTGKPIAGIPQDVRLWVSEGRLPDYMANSVSWQIVSDRFLAVLEKIVSPADFQVFPAPLYDHTSKRLLPAYSIINVTRCLDALAAPLVSVGSMIVNGARVPPDANLFRIVGHETVLVASQALRQEASNLQGVSFITIASQVSVRMFCDNPNWILVQGSTPDAIKRATLEYLGLSAKKAPTHHRATVFRSDDGFGLTFAPTIHPYSFVNLIGWLDDSRRLGPTCRALGWITSPGSGIRYCFSPQGPDKHGCTLAGISSDGVPVEVNRPDGSLTQTGREVASPIEEPSIPSNIENVDEFIVTVDSDKLFGNADLV